MPAAGYIAMAVEAMYQRNMSIHHLDKKVADCSYRLRDVHFDRALILDDNTAGRKIMLTLAQSQNAWHDFKILSLVEGEWTQHCRGLVELVSSNAGGESYVLFPKTVANINVATSLEGLQPLRHTVSAQAWYKAMRKYGYRFGPCFQKQLDIESFAGCRQNRTLLSLAEVPSKHPQSTYLLHPASIDGCLQSGGPSLWEGHRSSISALLVPAVIDEMTLYGHDHYPEEAVAVSSATYTGNGPIEHPENYATHTAVYDPATGASLMRVSGLRYHTLNGYSTETPHTYLSSSWRPDITFLTQSQLCHLLANMDRQSYTRNDTFLWPELDFVLDLIAYKKPNSNVAELSLCHPSQSLWLHHGPLASIDRGSCRTYHFTCNSLEVLHSFQQNYSIRANVHANLVDHKQPQLGLPVSNTGLDVLVLQLVSNALRRQVSVC